MLKTSLLSAALLALGLGTAAHAQSKSRAVAVADLDLSSATDRATLEQRIAKAAQGVCRTNERLTLDVARRTQNCTQDAQAKAMKAAGLSSEGQQMAQR